MREAGTFIRHCRIGRILFWCQTYPRQTRARCGWGNHRFRHFETWDKVYTEIVPDASKATLQKVIRGRVGIGSVINTDGWRGYQGLVDMGFAKHFRVHYGDNEFVRGTRHINGIESLRESP